MKSKVKWGYVLAAGLIAGSVLVAGAFIFVTGVEAVTARTERGLLGGSRVPQEMMGIAFGIALDEDPPLGGYLEALAEALGITVEKLEAAIEVAREAAIEDGIAGGRMLGERFTEGEEPPYPPGRGQVRGAMFGGPMNEYLADALGISLDKLEAAQEQARETMLADAIEAGKIDPEHLERMELMEALRPYLIESMQGAFQDALKAAVADGAISQAEADQLAESFASRADGIRPQMRFGGQRNWMRP